jgi:hypothetical protein
MSSTRELKLIEVLFDQRGLTEIWPRLSSSMQSWSLEPSQQNADRSL